MKNELFEVKEEQKVPIGGNGKADLHMDQINNSRQASKRDYNIKSQISKPQTNNINFQSDIRRTSSDMNQMSNLERQLRQISDSSQQLDAPLEELIQSFIPNTRKRHPSMMSINSVGEDLMKSTIGNNEISVNLMSDINQIYLEQIKETLTEIRNNKRITASSRFKEMQEVMAEYKEMVKNQTN